MPTVAIQKWLEIPYQKKSALDDCLYYFHVHKLGETDVELPWRPGQHNRDTELVREGLFGISWTMHDSKPEYLRFWIFKEQILVNKGFLGFFKRARSGLTCHEVEESEPGPWWDEFFKLIDIFIERVKAHREHMAYQRRNELMGLYKQAISPSKQAGELSLPKGGELKLVEHEPYF